MQPLVSSYSYRVQPHTSSISTIANHTKDPLTWNAASSTLLTREGSTVPCSSDMARHLPLTTCRTSLLNPNDPLHNQSAINNSFLFRNTKLKLTKHSQPNASISNSSAKKRKAEEPPQYVALPPSKAPTMETQQSRHAWQASQAAPIPATMRTTRAGQVPETLTSEQPQQILLPVLQSNNVSTTVSASNKATSDGDYRIVVGERLPSLSTVYEVLSFLGRGTFGQVVKARCTCTHNLVAIKILKNHPSYQRQGNVEIGILQTLSREDTEAHNLVRALECFQHCSHTCLVFELLEQNLYDYLKAHKFRPLTLAEIRPITQQVLVALAKLKQLGFIHADLKPENIMLVNNSTGDNSATVGGNTRFRVKVIDFGSACHTSKAVANTYLQSRYYRAPEILLGLPFNEAIDMWSLGCVIAELYLGWPLYPGSSEYDQMRYIVETQGMPPLDMLLYAAKDSRYFKVDTQNNYRLKRPEEHTAETGQRTKEARKFIFPSLRSIEDAHVVHGNTTTIQLNRGWSVTTNEVNMDGFVDALDRREFSNLLCAMMSLPAKMRISPDSALQQPFLTLAHLQPYLECSNRARDSLYMMHLCRHTPQISPKPPSLTSTPSSLHSAFSHMTHSTLPSSCEPCETLTVGEPRVVPLVVDTGGGASYMTSATGTTYLGPTTASQQVLRAVTHTQPRTFQGSITSGSVSMGGPGGQLLLTVPGDKRRTTGPLILTGTHPCTLQHHPQTSTAITLHEAPRISGAPVQGVSGPPATVVYLSRPGGTVGPVSSTGHVGGSYTVSGPSATYVTVQPANAPLGDHFLMRANHLRAEPNVPTVVNVGPATGTAIYHTAYNTEPTLYTTGTDGLHHHTALLTQSLENLPLLVGEHDKKVIPIMRVHPLVKGNQTHQVTDLSAVNQQRHSMLLLPSVSHPTVRPWVLQSVDRTSAVPSSRAAVVVATDATGGAGVGSGTGGDVNSTQSSAALLKAAYSMVLHLSNPTNSIT